MNISKTYLTIHRDVYMEDCIFHGFCEKEKVFIKPDTDAKYAVEIVGWYFVPNGTFEHKILLFIAKIKWFFNERFK